MTIQCRGAQCASSLRISFKAILRASLFKLATSRLFYKVNRWVSDVQIEVGAADFRLLDRKVVNALRSLSENDLFWRGLVAWVGFRQVALPYRAMPRQHGSSKYTLDKMLRLASSGMTAFSTKPLKFALIVGLLLTGLSLLYAVYIVIVAFMGKVVSGWTSLALLIIFFGGMQFLFLGILGEYVGRIFMENKKRPCYFISRTNIEKVAHG